MLSGIKFRIGRLSISVKRWRRGAFLIRSGLRIPKSWTPVVWPCLSSALPSLSGCSSSVSEDNTAEFSKVSGAEVEVIESLAAKEGEGRLEMARATPSTCRWAALISAVQRVQQKITLADVPLVAETSNT